MPVAVLFIPVLIFVWMPGTFHLFEWADPSIVKDDHILQNKAAYLNPQFFTLRGLVFFAIWIGFAKFFIGRSIEQDAELAGRVESTLTMRKWATLFMPLYGFTVTFAAFDWLMSLSNRLEKACPGETNLIRVIC